MLTTFKYEEEISRQKAAKQAPHERAPRSELEAPPADRRGHRHDDQLTQAARPPAENAASLQRGPGGPLPSGRQAIQVAGLLCLASGQVYDNFAVFVSD